MPEERDSASSYIGREAEVHRVMARVREDKVQWN